MAKKWTLIAAALVLAAVGLTPIVVMFARSLTVEGHLSLARYAGLLRSGREWVLLYHSVLLASLTTLFSLLLGVPLGVLLAKSDLPCRRFFAVLFLIPLIIPSYITALAWLYCLGRGGLVGRILGAQAGITTSRFLFSLPGVLLVMVSTLLPVVILLTWTYLRTVNPRMEEAAKLSAGWFRVLTNISLPAALPGILLAALLVFILSLGEFGVPSSLRYEVFSVETFVQFSAFYDFNAATAAAVPLGFITLLALVLERLFLRRKTFQIRLAHAEMYRIVLRRSKPFFLLGVSFVGVVLVVIPLGVLLYQSASFQAYGNALTRSWDSILRSLLYGAVGACGIAVLGLPLGYLLQRRALRFSYVADSVAIFLLALPGTVIGIGLVSLWNRPATNWVYGTAIIIILGYLAQYTALGERIMAASFTQVPGSMEEAAQIVGGRWFRRLFGVLVPLVRKGILAAWLVGFIFCLRDLGITMLVYPPARDTLPVRIFTMMANSPAETIAAMCIIMVVITLLPLAALGIAIKHIR